MRASSCTVAPYVPQQKQSEVSTHFLCAMVISPTALAVLLTPSVVEQPRDAAHRFNCLMMNQLHGTVFAVLLLRKSERDNWVVSRQRGRRSPTVNAEQYALRPLRLLRDKSRRTYSSPTCRVVQPGRTDDARRPWPRRRTMDLSAGVYNSVYMVVPCCDPKCCRSQTTCDACSVFLTFQDTVRQRSSTIARSPTITRCVLSAT